MAKRRGKIEEFLSELDNSESYIGPFEEAEMISLLAQPDRSSFASYRDYTIMLVLLDTGVRVSELVNMKMSDVDIHGSRVKVWGKGSKEREVIFQATTGRFLHRYMQLRGSDQHDYLWITDMGNPMNPRGFQERLTLYGRQAELNSVRVSPHTFRHTCAKMYILKGGYILSLQKLLGHSSLEMVRHYVDLWGSDLQQMHRKYSPVESLFQNG
jgi:integrase/recombinase XerD